VYKQVGASSLQPRSLVERETGGESTGGESTGGEILEARALGGELSV